MNVLSAEGLRCDSAGAELRNLSGCCDHKQQRGNGSSDGAGCVCLPGVLERASGDRYLMEPPLLALPFEITLRCKSSEPGAGCCLHSKALCIWGVLLPITGVPRQVSEAPRLSAAWPLLSHKGQIWVEIQMAPQ